MVPCQSGHLRKNVPCPLFTPENPRGTPQRLDTSSATGNPRHPEANPPFGYWIRAHGAPGEGAASAPMHLSMAGKYIMWGSTRRPGLGTENVQRVLPTPLADLPTSGPSAMAPMGTHGAVGAPMPPPPEDEDSGSPVGWGGGPRETP